MARLNTTCPRCGAPHARKLSMIHAEGLSTVDTEIETVGTFNTIGRQQITTQGTETGIQQTQASKDAAPPELPKLITIGTKIRLGLRVFGIGFCIWGFLSDSSLFSISGVLMIVGSFAVSTDPTDDEQREYDNETQHLREELDSWEKTFQCSACGERFVPIEAVAA